MNYAITVPDWDDCHLGKHPTIDCGVQTPAIAFHKQDRLAAPDDFGNHLFGKPGPFRNLVDVPLRHPRHRLKAAQ